MLNPHLRISEPLVRGYLPRSLMNSDIKELCMAALVMYDPTAEIYKQQIVRKFSSSDDSVVLYYLGSYYVAAETIISTHDLWINPANLTIVSAEETFFGAEQIIKIDDLTWASQKLKEKYIATIRKISFKYADLTEDEKLKMRAFFILENDKGIDRRLIGLSKRELQLHDYLLSHRMVSTKDILMLFQISSNSARKLLHKFADIGILERHGRGNQIHYIYIPRCRGI